MKKVKTKQSERDLQIACARFLDSQRHQEHLILWCHVPNSIYTNHINAYWHKRQGMKAGVPDILIFEPNGTYNGLAIELKVGKNKPTKSQKEWLELLERCNWKTAVIYNIDDFIKAFEGYFSEASSK